MGISVRSEEQKQRRGAHRRCRVLTRADRQEEGGNTHIKARNTRIISHVGLRELAEISICIK